MLNGVAQLGAGDDAPRDLELLPVAQVGTEDVTHRASMFLDLER